MRSFELYLMKTFHIEKEDEDYQEVVKEIEVKKHYFH
jgi:hypothetical protein